MSHLIDPQVAARICSESLGYTHEPDSKAAAVARDRLHQLYERIPSRCGMALRMVETGCTTVAAGEKMGVTQATAWGRMRYARHAATWAAQNLPDMSPREVKRWMRYNGYREGWADAVAVYWQEWSYTEAARSLGVPYSTVYDLVGRLRETLMGPVGDGLRALEHPPRYVGTVIAARQGNESS